MTAIAAVAVICGCIGSPAAVSDSRSGNAPNPNLDIIPQNNDPSLKGPKNATQDDITASQKAICDSLKNESQRKHCIDGIAENLKDKTYYISC